MVTVILNRNLRWMASEEKFTIEQYRQNADNLL